MDYNAGKAWNVMHIGEHEFHCEEEAVEAKKMPVPSFGNFTYKGQQNVQVLFRFRLWRSIDWRVGPLRGEPL